jgi:hypothetical protein
VSLVRATTLRSLVRVSVLLAGEQQAAVHVHTSPTHVVRTSFAGFRALSELFTGLVYEFQGGGIPIAAGMEINVNKFPFPCRVIAARVTSTEQTDAEIEFSRSTFADFPVFDPIGTIEIDNVDKAEADTELWDNVFEKGDMLKAKVLSNTNAKTLSLTLDVVRLSSNG